MANSIAWAGSEHDHRDLKKADQFYQYFFGNEPHNFTFTISELTCLQRPPKSSRHSTGYNLSRSPLDETLTSRCDERPSEKWTKHQKLLKIKYLYVILQQDQVYRIDDVYQESMDWKIINKSGIFDFGCTKLILKTIK